MSLTGICSPESARRKFFMNSKYIMSRNVFGSGGRNGSNGHLLAGTGERKIFHELEVHHV